MMRLKKLTRDLAREGILPYLVSSLPNIEYLTGFKGSYGTLLIARKGPFFISDSRYEEYAKKILPRGVEFVLQKDGLPNAIREVLEKTADRALYLEEHSLTLGAYYALKDGLAKVKLLRGGDAVNALRVVKDPGEIELLREAAAITDRCVEHLAGFVKPGLTEWEVATEIEDFYRGAGCRGSSFSTIVASGAGSSMPHYDTSMEKTIEEGDALLIDMGCHFRGYNSDLTRTFFMGWIDEEMRRIYGIVREAQEAALEAVRPGVTAGKLDSIARGIIAKNGFGEAFGHSLGHGIGIDVHEVPAIRAKSPFRLKKNTVITIEPGIYIPGIGGVRIEDMVLVTEAGREVLTHFTKDIVVIH